MRRKNTKSEKKQLVSIVIPAYKAERTIQENILEIKKVLDRNLEKYDYEIICVADGKIDKTYSIAKRLSKKHSQIKATGYLTNLGKGHAVRFGMARAKGDIIGFIDAGGDIDPKSILMALSHFDWYDADIIVGSKRHPVSRVFYPWQRRIISFGYQMIVRFLFNLTVRDTQVGLKFYKREILEKVLPRLLVKKFAFDIELLSVASMLGYKKIYESPVNLRLEFRGGLSTIASSGFLKTSFSMFRDTLAVFYRLRILDFYNYKNRKNWITPDYLMIKKK